MEKSRSWPSAHDWKSCIPQKGIEGSNPSFSAIALISFEVRVFYSYFSPGGIVTTKSGRLLRGKLFLWGLTYLWGLRIIIVTGRQLPRKSSPLPVMRKINRLCKRGSLPAMRIINRPWKSFLSLLPESARGLITARRVAAYGNLNGKSVFCCR